MASARLSFPITKRASASAAWPSWCRWRTTTTSAVITCWAAVPSAAARPSTVDDLPEGNTATGGSVYRGSVLPTMYKKLIENSLDILYDKLQESKDKQLVVGVSNYLMLAVYKMFRQMYEASPKNISGMFRVGSARWNSSADAAMQHGRGRPGGHPDRRGRHDATAWNPPPWP